MRIANSNNPFSREPCGMGKIAGGKKPLTPMRVFRAVQNRVMDRLQPLNAFRGVYADFPEAERAAPPTKPLGYDAADSADWYLKKLAGVQLEDYPVLYWLRAAFDDSRTLLEIGGHVGVAYYGFSRVIQYPADLRWTILDVPSVVDAGTRLARERGRTDVAFVKGLAETEGAEILLAAGALQYFDAPSLAGTITALRVKPKHVLVNVTPVYDGPGFVTLQNIGSVYCPYRIFNRQEFIAPLEALGYRLVDAWEKPRPFSVPKHPDRSFDAYSGFYLRRG
ncbi:MAG: TIGR04325 family methyltransferase [Acidobacteriota bacterium]